jgi:hypothetical protein
LARKSAWKAGRWSLAVPVGGEGGPAPEVGVKKSLRAAEGGAPVSIC